MEDYYSRNSRDYLNRTVNADMETLYTPFLALVPDGGYILDAGCGSGRDALAFKKKGYVVTAMDASQKIVELAREYTGMQVVHMRFDELRCENEFDGIWACASLLHCSKNELFGIEGAAGIFHKLIMALKPGGVMYMSFKKGEGERIDEKGRRYLDFTPGTLADVIAEFPDVEIVKIWENVSTNGKNRTYWVNGLVNRKL